MSDNGTAAATGPAMSPDQEDEHQQRLREVYLAQADESIEGIEATIKGLQESLKAAKAERKRLRDGGRV